MGEMTALFHASDLHLDHLSNAGRHEFYRDVRNVCGEGSLLLITGDITVAARLAEDVEALSDACGGRVAYVLGNHDYWGSSFSAVDAATRELNARLGSKTMCLDHVDRIRLSDDTFVVGDSGWYDGRNGSGYSSVFMNDWRYIRDYATSRRDSKAISAEVADVRAVRLSVKLDAALAAGAKKIVALTHVPPFAEACRYQGRPTDEHMLYWYSSRVIGDVLDGFCSDNPDVAVEVLCGHTHGGCRHVRHAGLAVTVAEAEYSWPRIAPWSPGLFAI